MREWHGVVVREEREQGEVGAGAGWRLAVVVVAVGGEGGGWLVYDAIPHKHSRSDDTDSVSSLRGDTSRLVAVATHPQRW